MINNLYKIEYKKSELNLDCLYMNDEAKKGFPLFESKKVKEVYGELCFNNTNVVRPYIFTSLVHSIDGRIAFSDAPEGPFVASKNKCDQVGGNIDFWILNVLRSQSDGCIMGANTLVAEENYTVHVFDADVEKERVESGLPAVPWNIITSIDGSDIPYNHPIFTNSEIPKIINTSPKAKEVIESSGLENVVYLPEISSEEELKEFSNITLDSSKIYVIFTDDNGYPDTKLYLRILKILGINNLLVESPTLMHIYMENQVMDELFFNCSCLYIGGKALTMGTHGREFTSENHPHTKILSIHMHSPHFTYVRHKLVY